MNSSNVARHKFKEIVRYEAQRDQRNLVNWKSFTESLQARKREKRITLQHFLGNEMAKRMKAVISILVCSVGISLLEDFVEGFSECDKWLIKLFIELCRSLQFLTEFIVKFLVQPITIKQRFVDTYSLHRTELPGTPRSTAATLSCRSSSSANTEDHHMMCCRTSHRASGVKVK